jgi:hypothetical protein
VFVLDGTKAGTVEGISRLAYDGSTIPLTDTDVGTAQVTTRDIDRGDSPHFLLKEIGESPNSFRKTLRGKIVERNGVLHALVGARALPPEVATRLATGAITKVRVIGQGTAAVAGRSMADVLDLLCEGTLDIDPITATELSGFGLRLDMSDTLVVAVSQSGTTTDTNRTVDLARSRGAAVLAIAFLLTSLTNLSKAWRDRFDALFFHDAARQFPERFAEISRGVHTLEAMGGFFYSLNLAAAVISTASILAAIFVPSGNNLELSWKLLLAIAILFMISAAVNASKFVRDSMEEGAIKPTPQWRAIVILSVVVSLAAVFGLEAVVCINSQVSSRLCALLYIGSFWVLGSVITLSKITRDRDEKTRSVIKAADLAAAVQRSARR